jgi:hypothetical protein
MCDQNRFSGSKIVRWCGDEKHSFDLLNRPSGNSRNMKEGSLLSF